MKQTTLFVTRKDGITCMIAKVKNHWEVFDGDGRNTGYHFRTKKEAVEYCHLGF